MKSVYAFDDAGDVEVAKEIPAIRELKYITFFITSAIFSCCKRNPSYKGIEIPISRASPTSLSMVAKEIPAIRELKWTFTSDDQLLNYGCKRNPSYKGIEIKLSESYYGWR